MAQLTLQEVAEAQREAAHLELKATQAQREAQRASAKARDLLEQFCAQAGVPISIVKVSQQ